MIRVFWENLSKLQKICVMVFLQLIIIGIVVSVLMVAMQNREHVAVDDNTGQTSHIPEGVKKAYEDALWEIISNNVSDADRSIINDVVVRENSYVEDVDEDGGSTQVSFLVDIDSIQQTYRIVAGWLKGSSEPIDKPIIDCPLLGETKYPDSVCYAVYRDTFSLSLYLPYMIESYDDEHAAPDIYIAEGEEEYTIDVMVSVCDSDQFIQEAKDYLESLPIDLSEYEIRYNINSVDVSCSDE